MAAVLSVVASATAPCFVMSKTRSGNVGARTLRAISAARSQASAVPAFAETRRDSATAVAPAPRMKIRRLIEVCIASPKAGQFPARAPLLPARAACWLPGELPERTLPCVSGRDKLTAQVAMVAEPHQRHSMTTVIRSRFYQTIALALATVVILGFL